MAVAVAFSKPNTTYKAGTGSTTILSDRSAWPSRSGAARKGKLKPR
jgi:hypothetical protein